MNIAKIMIPKISTVFLHEKDTIRQGLERFMVHGYTAVPVLNDQEQYIESVTEGDFLRHLLVCQTTDLKVSNYHLRVFRCDPFRHLPFNVAVFQPQRTGNAFLGGIVYFYFSSLCNRTHYT